MSRLLGTVDTLSVRVGEVEENRKALEVQLLEESTKLAGFNKRPQDLEADLVSAVAAGKKAELQEKELEESRLSLENAGSELYMAKEALDAAQVAQGHTKALEQEIATLSNELDMQRIKGGAAVQLQADLDAKTCELGTTTRRYDKQLSTFTMLKQEGTKREALLKAAYEKEALLLQQVKHNQTLLEKVPALEKELELAKREKESAEKARRDISTRINRQDVLHKFVLSQEGDLNAAAGLKKGQASVIAASLKENGLVVGYNYCEVLPLALWEYIIEKVASLPSLRDSTFSLFAMLSVNRAFRAYRNTKFIETLFVDITVKVKGYLLLDIAIKEHKDQNKGIAANDLKIFVENATKRLQYDEDCVSRQHNHLFQNFVKPDGSHWDKYCDKNRHISHQFIHLYWRTRREEERRFENWEVSAQTAVSDFCVVTCIFCCRQERGNIVPIVTSQYCQGLKQ
jgi:hypothetical protein